MGYKQIEMNMPIEYDGKAIFSAIKKLIGHNEFSYNIELKSLDARNKRNLQWKMRIGVFSNAFQETQIDSKKLHIPYAKRNKKVIVIGSGPAGFFAAFILQKTGFATSIIERGSAVEKRSKLISNFEKNSSFSSFGNYAFGEGGSGTFSDGKLTSRTKNIHMEKQFIIDSYIESGDPSEIAYLSNPHIGTNNLIKIVKKLREKFIELGGTIHFETTLTNINISGNIAKSIDTTIGQLDCDDLFIASGHSAFDTFR